MPIYKTDKPTKDGRSFYFVVSYTDSHGKYKQYRSKLYATKKACQFDESLFIASKKDKTPADMTVGELVAEYLALKCVEVKPNTKNSYITIAKYITKTIGDIKLSRLTAHDCCDIITNYDGKNSTKKIILRFLRSALESTEYPTPRIPRMKLADVSENKNDYYTLQECKVIADNMPSLNLQTLIYWQYMMGLRIGESLALKIKDIKDGKVTIDKTIDKQQNIGTAKTANSYRTLPIPKQVLEKIGELVTYWKKHPGYSDEWYLFSGYQPIPYITVVKAFNNATKKLNMRHLRLHTLRHTTASNLVSKGASIVLVAKWLGHTPQMTLAIYSHLWNNELNSIKEELEKDI